MLNIYRRNIKNVYFSCPLQQNSAGNEILCMYTFIRVYIQLNFRVHGKLNNLLPHSVGKNASWFLQTLRAVITVVNMGVIGICQVEANPFTSSTQQILSCYININMHTVHYISGLELYVTVRIGSFVSHWF